jgi:hypothetical protein
LKRVGSELTLRKFAEEMFLATNVIDTHEQELLANGELLLPILKVFAQSIRSLLHSCAFFM